MPGETGGKRAWEEGSVLEAALAQLGPFGHFQGYVLVMLCLPNLFVAMYTLNYVFVADAVPFRCVVPECEGSNTQFDNEAAAALLPSSSQCTRYSPLHVEDASCRREHFHPNDTIPCDTFVYQNYDTIFAEFALACRERLHTLEGRVRGAALPLVLLAAYYADKFGRRTAFCILSACIGVTGIIKAFSVNYYMYLGMKFLEDALGYGFYGAGYVLMLEMAPAPHRALFASATGVAYGVGGVLLAAAARALPHWRHLLLAVHVLALLLPLYHLLVDESPRWLHSKGHLARCQNVIRRAAVWNKVVVDEEVMTRLSEETKILSEAVASPWRSLVRSRVLLARFAVCCWCWVAAAFLYYGLTVNSVALSENKHVNLALNMAMEIVASLLIMMALERIGRRMCIFLGFVLCGIACVLSFFIWGAVLPWAGRLMAACSYYCLHVLTAELQPTHMRCSTLAACSLVGRIATVLAPHTARLHTHVQVLLYGACSGSAALLVLLVPETCSTLLPQRVADAERLQSASTTPVPWMAPPPQPPRQLSADT